LLPVSTTLGELSFNAYRTGHFFNAKSYMIESYGDEKKLKQKGVQKMKREEFFNTGKTTQKKPIRLRAALKGVQGHKVNEWIEQEYGLKTNYRKREIAEDFGDFQSTRAISLHLGNS